MYVWCFQTLRVKKSKLYKLFCHTLIFICDLQQCCLLHHKRQNIKIYSTLRVTSHCFFLSKQTNKQRYFIFISTTILKSKKQIPYLVRISRLRTEWAHSFQQNSRLLSNMKTRLCSVSTSTRLRYIKRDLIRGQYV